MDNARISLTERRLESVVGAVLCLVALRFGTAVFVVTACAFALTWGCVVFSTNRRHRKSLTFGRRLLVTTVLIACLWTFFGFALGIGDRSDDPTTLPTLISIG